MTTTPAEPQRESYEADDALVSIAELKDHMSGATLRSGQMRDAAVVLIGLQRGLERRLNRRFTNAGVTEERAFTDRDGYAMLRRTPVTVVESVTYENGTEAVGWAPRRNGLVVGGRAYAWVVVRYEGGYVALDPSDLEDLRLAILDKARDAMTDNHDDTVSAKGLDTREPPARRPPPTTPLWTDAEVKQFDRLRRRVVL